MKLADTLNQALGLAAPCCGKHFFDCYCSDNIERCKLDCFNGIKNITKATGDWQMRLEAFKKILKNTEIKSVKLKQQNMNQYEIFRREREEEKIIIWAYSFEEACIQYITAIKSFAWNDNKQKNLLYINKIKRTANFRVWFEFEADYNAHHTINIL